MFKSNDQVNVLIMAVGSPLGQSILKAVQKSSLPVNVHVADISSLAAGLYMGNVTPVIFPLIREQDYFQRLTEYVDNHKINIIFPTIAAEHDFFAAHIGFFKERGIHIVSCAPDVFRICNDKYLSMQFLQNKGLTAPDTVLCSNEDDVAQFVARNSFPVILKPRFGASSNDVFVVHNIERLFGILKAYPDDYFILQAFLADPADYTIGVFVSQDRRYQDTFVIRRNLKFGLSYSGEVIEDDVISRHCLDIANALHSTYSINVQLKMVDRVPYTYEVNPRLSSTTSVRAHFGFNEPDMIMRDLLEKAPLTVRVAAKRGFFMRYWEETYLESA
jgi:carbamoyl-phosphate synthase large subunit